MCFQYNSTKSINLYLGSEDLIYIKNIKIIIIAKLDTTILLLII